MNDELADLDYRRRNVLAQMSVLADCASGSYVKTTKHKAKGESRTLYEGGNVDEGEFVYWRRRLTGPDWPDLEWLDANVPQGHPDWDHDYLLAETLVIEAEAALKRRRGDSAVPVTEDGYARTKQMVKDHVGHTIHQMARAEKISEPLARKARYDMRVCIECGRERGCKFHAKR